MKIFGVLSISFLLISLNGISQEFNAGIYAGVVASQLDGDKYEGYNKAGIISGAYVNRNFNKKWAWQAGLRYTQKGSKHVDGDAGIYYKSQLNYIEAPLTVRYQHFKKVDFEVGISLGYLAKAMEKIGEEDLKEAEPPFNKLEVASIFGGSYHFNKKISAGAFFSYSLTSVRPFSSAYDDLIEKGQHNNLFYFTLAYKLSSWQ